MVLDGVDVFVKVVQAGGFSAAARQLGMPATTVSAKIARLEERLGVTLIQRSTRKMHVTAAGEAYYAHCNEALRALEAGELQLAAANETPNGMLRLTAPSDLAQSILPAMIRRYVDTYPLASIDLIVTNQQVDLLADGVDLAIRAGVLTDSNLQTRKFGSAQLGLYASKAYLKARGTPRGPEDLGGHDLLIHSRFPPDLYLTAKGPKRFKVQPSRRIRADDMQTLRALAAAGAGIALLPAFEDAQHAFKLERILPECGTQAGTVYFVYPAGKYTPINVRAFMDIALQLVG